jgi:hypothetical protein
MGIRIVPPFGAGGGGGIGTVSSVNASGPAGVLTWTGGPVTTSGTLAASLNSQSTNLFLAGPPTGPSAAPTFRTIVGRDVGNVTVPDLDTRAMSTLTLANGQNDNVPIGYWLDYLVTGTSADFSVTGFVTSVRDGQRATIFYTGTNVFTLKNQSTGSSVGNRIACPGGTDLALTGPCAVTIEYDATDTEYLVVSYAAAPSSVTGFLKADGTVPMTGDLNANSHKVVNLTNGSSAQDAAAFGQLPSAVQKVPTSPNDATQFLNGATTPAFAQVKDSDLSTSDITTNNASSTKHGFSPKSPADATKFLNGASTPAYAQVKDSDLSVSDITTNNVSITAHGFAPKAPNDSTQFLNGTGAYSFPTTGGSNLFPFTAPPLITSGISTTLNGGINNAVTSLVVASSSGFPATPFIFRIDTEAFTCTNVSGTTWTVTRAYNSTSAASHSNGATVTLSNWEWLNQGSQATVTQLTSPITSIYMDSGLESAATNLRIYRRLMGANTKLYAGLFPAWGIASNSLSGIVWRESATGKMYTMGAGFANGAISTNIGKFTAPGTFSANILTGNATTSPIWYQVEVSGASLFFRTATDGIPAHFTKCPVTEGKTAFFTTGPDEWGFVVQGASTSFSNGMNLVSWLEST